MQETPNLKLKKPDLTDYVNVGDLNENADKIDIAIQTEKERVTTHLAGMASQELGKGASLVGVHDAGNLFIATTVEAALKEAITQANAAFTSASNGKTAIGNAVTGVDPTVVIPFDPTFLQLATAIGQISTGKKFASGTVNPSPSEFFTNVYGTNVSMRPVIVSGLDFKPNFILLRRYRSGNTDLVVYFSPDISNPYYTGSTVISVAMSSNNSPTLAQYLKADVMGAVVNETSFKIPTSMNVTQEMEWFAFE